MKTMRAQTFEGNCMGGSSERATDDSMRCAIAVGYSALLSTARRWESTSVTVCLNLDALSPNENCPDHPKGIGKALLIPVSSVAPAEIGVFPIWRNDNLVINQGIRPDDPHGSVQPKLLLIERSRDA